MFRVIITVIVLSILAGVVMFASPTAKDKVAKSATAIVENAAEAGGALLKDAAGNAADVAADAAADEIEEQSQKFVSRVREIRAQGSAKMKKRSND